MEFVDNDTKSFPTVDKIKNENLNIKSNTEITEKLAMEINNLFAGDAYLFKQFLSSIIKTCAQNTIPVEIFGPFLRNINEVLFQGSSVRINQNGGYQEILTSSKSGEVSLNEITPPIIKDYIREAIECFNEEQYRSSIVFCTFSLEGALRIKYNILKNKPSTNFSFKDLIDWGISNKFIEQNQFNEININFMREYRNSLVHKIISSSATDVVGQSREQAKKMCSIVLRLTELFINNIFA